MSENLENSAGAKDQKRSVFIQNPKKDNTKELTCQQGNVQNPSNQASTLHEPRTPRCTSQMQKRQKNKRENCHIHWIIEKIREFQKNIYFCFIDYAKTFVWITTNQKILKEMGILDHLICLLRNLYAGKEATEPDMEQQTGSKLRKA